MALGIDTESTGGGDSGDRMPYINYNAKAGRIYRIDRENTGEGWETFKQEITNDFQAIMDLENIEIGWLDFPTGAAPSFALSRIGDPTPDRPSPKHKKGFRVVIKLSQACAGGKPSIRELTGNAKVLVRGFDDLHDQYLSAKGANSGLLPVVKLEKSLEIESEYKVDGKLTKQTNYQPVFKIVKWVPRPDDLAYKPAAAAPAPAAQSAPPSTGSRQAEPPKAKVLEDDFAEF
jgi:hypothetical protein